MKWLRFAVPLLVFGLIGVLLFSGLGKDPKIVPSVLIGKAAPVFELPELHQPETRFTPATLRGKPYLLNVWGSWCVACREEHEVLSAFAARNLVPVVGLNWKDQREDAQRWLQQFGDPYDHIPVDTEGRTAIDFGVYGAPETFIIDGQGVIRFKHIGPLTTKVIEGELMAAINAAQGAAP